MATLCWPVFRGILDDMGVVVWLFCACRFLVVNSLTEHRTEVVNVLVSSVHISVVDSEGKPVKCQLNPLFNRTLHISPDEYEVTLQTELLIWRQVQMIVCLAVSLVQGWSPRELSLRSDTSRTVTLGTDLDQPYLPFCIVLAHSPALFLSES